VIRVHLGPPRVMPIHTHPPDYVWITPKSSVPWGDPVLQLGEGSLPISKEGGLRMIHQGESARSRPRCGPETAHQAWSDLLGTPSLAPKRLIQLLDALASNLFTLRDRRLHSNHLSRSEWSGCARVVRCTPHETTRTIGWFRAWRRR